MAKSKNNILTHGLSGLVGDLVVFRQRNGATIVANKPKQSTVPLSPEQILARKRFRSASAYAKAVVDDAAKSAIYQTSLKRGSSIYVMAVTDYLTPPEIDDINLLGYSGNIGQQIILNALDDFTVTSVRVEIKNADGTVLEEGAAAQVGGSLQWIYTATKKNNTLPGSTIKITATDVPGNQTERVVTL
ncbi:hypothetical protein [Pedobacter sp. SYSU D00535]|uniref:hypothetical protein n=1 Tax=Pedobacter sp. SYSU D00535 TaxID=2810308 RepID=UPI001A9664E6|nr:hypothetical protein [Pedobacter sp. SYSU D00535]